MLLSLKNIGTGFIRDTEIAGVEMLQYGDSYYVNLVVLRRKNNKIDIVLCKQGLTDFQETLNLITEKRPVYLILNLRNILHKNIEGIVSSSNESLIQEVFPNTHVADFYSQKEEIETGCIISITRCDILNNVLNDFTSHDMPIIGVTLGVFDLKYIQSILPIQEIIHTQNHILSFNNQRQINHFSKNTEGVYTETKIGDEILDSRLLPAYAAAFKALLQIPSNIQSPILEDIKSEYRQKRIYQKLSVYALGFIFFVLLSSTFLNYYYKDKINALSIQLVGQNTDFTALDSLKKQIVQQQSFMQQTNINRGSRISFFADRIAATIPVGLELTELNVFPILGNRKDYRETHLVKYDKETIIVKGVCDNSNTYNEWLKKIKLLDWVRTVMHIDYKDIDEQIGVFEMKITIGSSK
jgi:hypothetical protein